MKHLLWPCISIIALSACAVGPNFVRPDTQLSPDYRYINADTIIGDQNINQWWQSIDDPVLNDYINTLLSQNLDLKQAGERVIQAESRLRIQGGQAYPTLGVNTSASRTGTSFQNGFLNINERQYSNSYDAELQTSWEIDLFGRIRRSIESADANLQATIYDRQALTHSLIADLVNLRVSIAVNRRLIDLAEQNARNRKITLDNVDRRYNLGVSETSLADVLLAEENYTSVKADIDTYKRQLTNNMYTLDTLLGRLPGTTQLPDNEFPIADFIAPPASCLPAALLDRRPDLRASELRVKAANADVGIAIADLYPSLSLSGSAGFSGDSPNGLFDASQLATSIMASLTARLFEGGALRANIDLQEAEARELAHAYAANVLDAVEEVEGALQADNRLIDEINLLQKSVQSVKAAQTNIENRYTRGIAPLREVLDTQQRAYQIQQSLIQRQSTWWNTRIALYLALGGDWLSPTEINQKACP